MYKNTVVSAAARETSYSELRSRLDDMKRQASPPRPQSPQQMIRRQRPTWKRSIIYVESDWAGGRDVERRV